MNRMNRRVRYQGLCVMCNQITPIKLICDTVWSMVHKVLRLDTAKTYVLENKNDWMDPRIEYRKSIHSQRNIYCLCSILQLFSKILCISCLKTTIYIYNKPNVCNLKFFVSLSLTLLFLPENMQSA